MICSPRETATEEPSLADGDAHFSPLPFAEGDAQPAPRALALTAVDAVSVAVFALLVLALGKRLLDSPWSPRTGLGVAACAIVGYALADLVSGVVHWFGDTFFAEDTPILGAAFIHPFREHHRDPLAITRHGFLEVNGNNCLGLLPLLVPTWWLGAPSRPDDEVPWLAFQVMALVFSLATFGTNQFHKWAHQPGPAPRTLAWLRKGRLILDPAHHDGHHRAPHRSSYCVTVGWLNPTLDALGAFERAERGLRRLARRPRDGAGPSDQIVPVERAAGPPSR